MQTRPIIKRDVHRTRPPCFTLRHTFIRNLCMYVLKSPTVDDKDQYYTPTMMYTTKMTWHLSDLVISQGNNSIVSFS